MRKGSPPSPVQMFVVAVNRVKEALCKMFFLGKECDLKLFVEKGVSYTHARTHIHVCARTHTPLAAPF